MRNTPSVWTDGRNDRFLKAADVGDCTDVVDTIYGGYQSMPTKAGCHRKGVDCGGHFEIDNDTHDTDSCYVIAWFL